MLDLGAQVRRDSTVLDCFIIERRHRAVKAIANNVLNTTRFERSVLGSLINASIGGSSNRPELLGQAVELDGIMVADRMRVFSFEVSRGDIVMLAGTAGVVAGCCTSGGELFAIVQPSLNIRTITPHADEHMLEDGRLVFWLAREIRKCLAWQVRPDGSLLVIRE